MILKFKNLLRSLPHATVRMLHFRLVIVVVVRFIAFKALRLFYKEELLQSEKNFESKNSHPLCFSGSVRLLTKFL